MDDLISRQAAIDLLKQMRKDGDMIPWEGKDVFARIRKLPSTQPETHEERTKTHACDLIDRQAAIDALRKMQTYKLFSGDDMLLIDQAGAQTELMMLPSAQLERIKGHWVEIASSNHTYKCSECGRLLVNITDGKNNVAKNYPYCHCGAEMRGEQK